MRRGFAVLLLVSVPCAAHAQAADDPTSSSAPPAIVGSAASAAAAAPKSKARRDRKARICTNKGMWPGSTDVNDNPSVSDINSGDDWHSGGASDASGSFQD